jgi:hypothetical protein
MSMAKFFAWWVGLAATALPTSALIIHLMGGTPNPGWAIGGILGALAGALLMSRQ